MPDPVCGGRENKSGGGGRRELSLVIVDATEWVL